MDNIIRYVCILHNFVTIKGGTVNQLFTLKNNPDADVNTAPNISGRSYSGPFTDEQCSRELAGFYRGRASIIFKHLIT
jgi:hypothetical protein